MRFFFEPAEAPLWLKKFSFSIRDGLSDVWATALRLKDYATADLPPAADWKQGLVYDSTLNAPHYSNGTTWVRLSDYDADVAAIAALSTTGIIVRTGAGTAATRTLTAPAAGITVSNGDGVAGNPTLALANDLGALEALTGTDTIYRRSGADTWSAVTIGANLGMAAGTLGSALGTAATKNTGTSGDAVPVLNGAATTWANSLSTSGRFSQAGSAAMAGYLETNSGFLASTTNLNPGIVFFSSGAAQYGVDLGHDGTQFGTRIISANGTRIIFALVNSGGAPASQSDFTVMGYITNDLFMMHGSYDTNNVSYVYKLNGTQVVATRKTGWSVDTGTAKRTANATYTAGTTLTFTDPPTAAEMGALATRLAAVEAALQDDSRTMKALKDDLHGTAGHGLIGT